MPGNSTIARAAAQGESPKSQRVPKALLRGAGNAPRRDNYGINRAVRLHI